MDFVFFHEKILQNSIIIQIDRQSQENITNLDKKM